MAENKKYPHNSCTCQNHSSAPSFDCHRPNEFHKLNFRPFPPTAAYPHPVGRRCASPPYHPHPHHNGINPSVQPPHYTDHNSQSPNQPRSCACNNPRQAGPLANSPKCGGTPLSFEYFGKPFHWVNAFADDEMPKTGFVGGYDVDGVPIMVGRAFHAGDWIPAKVIPARRVTYVPYGGEEHAKDKFQVLCGQNFNWVPSSGGQVPPGAVEGGLTSTGETLYIGRVDHEGTLTIGKLQTSHGVCYIPFNGKEVGHKHYEVLVVS